MGSQKSFGSHGAAFSMAKIVLAVWKYKKHSVCQPPVTDTLIVKIVSHNLVDS